MEDENTDMGWKTRVGVFSVVEKENHWLCQWNQKDYSAGKSGLMIVDRHANLKYKYGNRHFWARGYFVDMVGRNKKAIKDCIANQLQEDQIAEPMSLKEYIDPFTGSKKPKA